LPLDLPARRLDAREVEQVVHDALHPLGVAQDRLEKGQARPRILLGAVQQCLHVPRRLVSGVLSSWLTLSTKSLRI